MSSSYRITLLGASALMAGSLAISQAHAQGDTADTAPQISEMAEGDMGSITVTARRRSESIVDVPLAISVVTSAKLEQLAIKDTSELAKYVPGLEFNNYSTGYSRNDRGAYRTLTFRGLAIGGGGNVSTAGSLFLDGAAVVGNEVPAGMDIGQVEILRGPQSVYFGRSSMTGAVSYRTKAIPDQLSAEMEVSYAERNAVNLEASVSAPIVPGLLKARLTGLYQDSEGYVRNDYDDSTLGDRSRKSISATIELTPSPTLEIKGYANYFRDEDGPSATAFVPASFSNCKFPGASQNTICGAAPGRANSINYFNTKIPTIVSDFIFSSPIGNSQFTDKVGGQREAYLGHVVVNWDIGDALKFQSITGYHKSMTQAVADGTAQPVQSTFPYSSYFYNLISRTRDFSQEVRLSSDPEQALSWTVGANYINAISRGAALTGFVNQALVLTKGNQGIGRQGANTKGIFGGAYYKATDAMTLSAEARYQWDRRSSYQLNGAGAVTFDQSALFKSFSPRVSIDYDIGGNRKVYISYATGNRPGGFNANILNYINNPTALAQIQSLLGLTNVAFKEEKLKVSELGVKGNFADGKGFFDINAYYGKLLDQQIGYGALIPALGFTVTATANVGETEIYGLEYQGSYNFSSDLSLSTTFSWNHSVRTKFTNTSGVAQFGTTDFDGKKFANVPEYTGAAVLAYSHPVSAQWNGFSNLAYTYRGKQYIDNFNAAFIKGRSQVDLRAGLSNDNYTLELFVRNLLDDRKYTGGSVAGDFGTLTYNAFFGAVAEPRQFGGRIRAKF